MSKQNEKRSASIFTHLDFIHNYQKALNNYSNSIKYYNNNYQIIDNIEKIINSYRDCIINFKKKLIQVKALIKPIYNEEKETYKFDNKIYSFNNNFIFILNQIFNNQIDSTTNIINSLEKNILSDTEKKRNSSFNNILQQNQKNIQTNYKKMEKSFNEYNADYNNFFEQFNDIEEKVLRYFSHSRKNKTNSKKNKDFNELFKEATNVHNNYKQKEDIFLDNNKKFFNFYSDKMKELEEEINKNNIYTEKIINSFKSTLITNNKIFLNSLEEQSKKVEESSNNINNNNNEKEKSLKEIKVIDHLKNFKEINLAPLETEYQNGKYKIKAIECKILGDNISMENKEVINDIFEEMSMEEDSYEDVSNIILTEEDVYNTVQFFYGISDYVDKSKYDLIIENNKIEVKNLVNKLLYFGMIKKDPVGYKDLKIINEDELKQLEDYIKSRKEYRIAFLNRFNYYRTFGIFEMPEKEFNLTSKFYVLITDCIADDKENETDFDTFKLLIILSETFYINKNGEKYYLIREIRGHRLFNEIDYITKYLDFCIKEEFEKSKKKTYNGISEKDKKDIVFATFLPFCNYMSEFGVSKESLFKISNSICEQYQLTDDLKANLNMMIQSS